ncbi:RNA polymerase sigma-70 factor [uncultured Draconibacterium sp.]|uniref:RNA polymerase sigma-70 factor n=1 Tax=uncultured Draconibacterium sp. TaxID=1573823 RepID=UPI0029C74778|nr:RNA polymerase sigma-70 factor [uncultured Draconibacterium sp.]
MSEIIDLHKILSALAQDDEASLEKLFNYYYPRLFNFSKSILKLEDGIDDILQEVFVKIWKNRKNINSAATFNSYIFIITRNLLLNELRRRLSFQNTKEEVKRLSLANEYSLSEQIDYQELKEKIDAFVEELPDRQKEVFLLSRSEGLSHKEIAEKLGIKPKTVEYHITLAVKCLKEKITGIGILSLLYFYLFF